MRTVEVYPYSFHAGIFTYRLKGADDKYGCDKRILSRRDRQAYCLYIRRPYGRRIQTACRGEPRTPLILQRCDPQKERIKLKPTIKQK